MADNTINYDDLITSSSDGGIFGGVDQISIGDQPAIIDVDGNPELAAGETPEKIKELLEITGGGGGVVLIESDLELGEDQAWGSATYNGLTIPFYRTPVGFSDRNPQELMESSELSTLMSKARSREFSSSSSTLALPPNGTILSYDFLDRPGTTTRLPKLFAAAVTIVDSTAIDGSNQTIDLYLFNQGADEWQPEPQELGRQVYQAGSWFTPRVGIIQTESLLNQPANEPNSATNLYNPTGALSSYNRSWFYDEGDVIQEFGKTWRRTSVAYDAIDAWLPNTPYLPNDHVSYGGFQWVATDQVERDDRRGRSPTFFDAPWHPLLFPKDLATDQRWVEITLADGASTNVVANPTGGTDAGDLSKLGIGTNTYTVVGGGTTVVPNAGPTVPAGGDLNTLGVGGITYDIAGSGGGVAVPEWDVATEYKTGDTVISGGNFYTTLFDFSGGADPNNNPIGPSAQLPWVLKGTLSTFNRNWKYEEGDIIIYGGAMHRRTEVPSNTKDWVSGATYGDPANDFPTSVFYNRVFFSTSETTQFSSTTPPTNDDRWSIATDIFPAGIGAGWGPVDVPYGNAPAFWESLTGGGAPDYVANQAYYPGNLVYLSRKLYLNYVVPQDYLGAWSATFNYDRNTIVVVDDGKFWKVNDKLTAGTLPSIGNARPSDRQQESTTGFFYWLPYDFSPIAFPTYWRLIPTSAATPNPGPGGINGGPLNTIGFGDTTYTITGGGGGGSVVTPNDPTGTDQGVMTSLNVDGDYWTTPPGGTANVIPNATTGTNEGRLTTIGVDGNFWTIAEGPAGLDAYVTYQFYNVDDQVAYRNEAYQLLVQPPAYEGPWNSTAGYFQQIIVNHSYNGGPNQYWITPSNSNPPAPGEEPGNGDRDPGGQLVWEPYDFIPLTHQDQWLLTTSGRAAIQDSNGEPFLVRGETPAKIKSLLEITNSPIVVPNAPVSDPAGGPLTSLGVDGTTYEVAGGSEWNVLQEYKAGDTVFDEGVSFTTRIDITGGDRPLANPNLTSTTNFWVPAAPVATYNRSLFYHTGALISVLGKTWRRTATPYPNGKWISGTSYGGPSDARIVYYENIRWSTPMTTSFVSTIVPPEDPDNWVLAGDTFTFAANNDTWVEVNLNEVTPNPTGGTDAGDLTTVGFGGNTYTVAGSGSGGKIVAPLYITNLFYELGSIVRYVDRAYILKSQGSSYQGDWDATTNYPQTSVVNHDYDGGSRDNWITNVLAAPVPTGQEPGAGGVDTNGIVYWLVFDFNPAPNFPAWLPITESIIANPSGAATDTLFKLGLEGTVYTTIDGSQGTNVVANPPGTPTSVLNTITVGGDILSVGGGAEYTWADYVIGSGFIETAAVSGGRVQTRTPGFGPNSLIYRFIPDTYSAIADRVYADINLTQLLATRGGSA